MATNITGVTMTQPLSDPGISPDGSFIMGGRITTAGGGGWGESGDMYFEWDQGTSTWATLGSTGALNVDAQTNPITGLQTASEQTITVYNDGTSGSFQIRVKLIEDDLTTYTTTPVDVVIAGAQTYYQNTGQGTISPSSSLPRQTYKTMGGYSLALTGTLASAALFSQGVGGGTISPSGILESATIFLCNVGGYALSMVGNLAKQTHKTIGGHAMSITGGLAKQMYKAVGGYAVTISGALDSATIFFQSVGEYAVQIAGAIAKKTSVYFGKGSVSPEGNISKQTSKSIGSATIEPIGTLTQGIVIKQNSGGGVISPSGVLGAVVTFVVSAGGYSVSIIGSLFKKTSKSIGGHAVIIGGVLSRVKTSVGGTVTRIKKRIIQLFGWPVIKH